MRAGVLAVYVTSKDQICQQKSHNLIATFAIIHLLPLSEGYVRTCSPETEYITLIQGQKLFYYT